MSLIRIYIVFLLCLFTSRSYSQQQDYDIGAATGIKQVGVNKVLCMKNGNTLLFHFEPRKAIVVKVYDSAHREIASKKHVCNLLDINRLETAMFKGLYDIGGNAVLFLQQEHEAKQELVSLSINGATGAIVEEKVLGKAQKVADEMHFMVIKNRRSSGYQVLVCRDVPNFDKCENNLYYYGDDCQLLKTVNIPLDRSLIKSYYVLGADAISKGTCVTFCLKRVVDSTVISGHTLPLRNQKLQNTLLMAYIPNDATVALEKQADLADELLPAFTKVTYDAFTSKINILLFSDVPYTSFNGTVSEPESDKLTLLVSIDPSDMSVKDNFFYNDSASAYYQHATGTDIPYDCIPLKMFTDDDGVTTIVSQMSEQHDFIPNPHVETRMSDIFFGDIAITQCDDTCNEFWGSILPLRQLYEEAGYSVYSLANLTNREQSAYLFQTPKKNDYNQQVAAAEVYLFHNSYYIIYNDYNANFENSLARPGKEVYSFGPTNACMYKLNAKKEVSKSYLYGERPEQEYNTVLINSGDFDYVRGIYAALVRCTQNGKTMLCMGWRRLD